MPKIPWWGWAVGGVLLVAGVVVWMRSRTKVPASSAALSAANAANSGAASPSADQLYQLQLMAQQSSQQQAQGVASITNALQALSPNMRNLGATPVAGYSVPPYTGESFQGSGYAVPSGNVGYIDALGKAYAWVTSPSTLQAILSSNPNANLVFQPTPGTAQPYKGANIAPGTPIYVEVPQQPASIGQQTPPTLAPGYSPFL